MAHYSNRRYHLLGVAVAAFLAAGGEAASSIFGFDIHHRSSSVVRRWAEARGRHAQGAQWPAHGSPEYYSELSRHDRALLARRLRELAGAEDHGLLTFAGGNDTYRVSSLGFLYYAEVSVGTPKQTFLVALDTGSNLFWVPCDCRQCGPTDPKFRPYGTRESTTSKPVTCDNALCDRPNACTNGSSCPYTVRYVSANTSSSGVLVEDVLHLLAGGGRDPVEAAVVLGCGQVQTGAFLDEGGSPDGLLGLGMDRVSVPSVLAAKGLVASDSFSMCFGDDGVGRINFGDAGSTGQAETPFMLASFHPTYNVSFTSVNVGGESSAVEFAAVMDSGTSFTYLNEQEYSALATNFNSLVRERRAKNLSDSVPFEYCYELSRGQTETMLPEVSLTTNNGRAVFPVTRPVVTLAAEENGQVRPIGYCLAILRNNFTVNIIGQNFMTGLKVVFDRQRNVLGWQEFDCYRNAADGPNAAPAPTTTLPPRQNSFPGAVPVPPHSASGSPSSSGGRSLLLLPLFLVAAAPLLA